MTEIEQEIRDNWFKNHVATLTTQGEITVLQWEKPGTRAYSCRYVFDGSKMYISGDIGSAVFDLTWKADVHSFNDVDIHYFDEKMSPYSKDKRDFNGDKAGQRIEKWKQELDAAGIQYDQEMMDNLIADAYGCSSREEWEIGCVNDQYNDFIVKLDLDYWEWIYTCGDEIPTRVYGYLCGLKMASEQLLSKKKERGLDNGVDKTAV